MSLARILPGLNSQILEADETELQILRGKHTVLSNHHFRIRIIYTLKHSFSGFSDFQIDGYCTVYKVKRHSAPLTVIHCLIMSAHLGGKASETQNLPTAAGILITTNAYNIVSYTVSLG